MRNSTGSSIPSVNVPGDQGRSFSYPLVKENEDSGYYFENRTEQRVLFVIQGF